MEKPIAALALAAPILLGLCLSGPARADPDVLWKLVHDRCVPDQRAHGQPAPCALVSETAGYAILKDRKGASQFLLIPTQRITGIEDPKILAAATPNYFALAWDNRHFTVDSLHQPVPRDALALAINSAYGRSQNQLHIHIDCIRPDVAQTLKAHENEIGDAWSVLAQPLSGHHYRVRRVVAETLEGTNPFALVAAQDDAVARDMAGQTIVVTGAHFADGRDGFYILNDQASLLALDHASGEELEDHSCAILAPR